MINKFNFKDIIIGIFLSILFILFYIQHTEIQTLKRKLTSNKTQISLIKRKIGSLSSSIDDREAEIQDLQSRIDDLEGEIDNTPPPYIPFNFD